MSSRAVAIIASVFLTGILATADAANLIAHYAFDGNANDASGSGYDAAVAGAVLTTDRFGKEDGAYYLGGSSYIQAASALVPLGAEGRTISVWVLPDPDGGPDQYIAGWGDPTAALPGEDARRSWFLNVYDGYYRLVTVQDNIFSDYEIQPKWTHLAATYDGSTMNLYKDGALVDSKQVLLDTGNLEGLLIGAMNVAPGAAGSHYKGKVDDVRVYDGALAPEEILRLLQNQPPVLDPVAPQWVSEGQSLQFTVSGSDPDGDALTFSASNLPTDARFDPSTRTFSWTPSYSQAGEYQVELSAEDGGDPLGLATEVVTITVENVNRAPVVTAPATQQVFEGQTLQFSVAASDPDGDALACSTDGLPSGAGFDPTTNAFSWTPAAGQTGTYTVTFVCTDDGAPSALTGEGTSVVAVSALPIADLCARLLEAIEQLHPARAVENRYLANVKKVATFTGRGMNKPAINQLNAFVKKVKQDVKRGQVNTSDGDRLIGLASELIGVLGG